MTKGNFLLSTSNFEFEVRPNLKFHRLQLWVISKLWGWMTLMKWFGGMLCKVTYGEVKRYNSPFSLVVPIILFENVSCIMKPISFKVSWKLSVWVSLGTNMRLKAKLGVYITHIWYWKTDQIWQFLQN